MFQFPGCPPMRLLIRLMVTGHYPSRVSPFGCPGLNACLRLPQAFRSLPRPSSAISASASTLCSFLLNLHSQACRSLVNCFCFTSSFRLALCSCQGPRSTVPENDMGKILSNSQSFMPVSLRPSGPWPASPSLGRLRPRVDLGFDVPLLAHRFSLERR